MALVLVLSLPLALMMILIGFAKLQQLPASLALATRVGVPETTWRAWGLADLVGAAGLILGAFASEMLALIAAGAITASLTLLLVLQARAREPLALLVPVIVLALLAVADLAAIAITQ